LVFCRLAELKPLVSLTRQERICTGTTLPSVRGERADGYPLRTHIDGENIVEFVCDDRRSPADEVNVPLAFPVDEFRVTDVLVGEQVCVLLGDVDGNTDTMPTFLLGVGDGECEPSRENCLLVVFDGDAVVAEDDRLFGVLSWVLVRPDFARLLFGGGVEVRVVIVNGILERAVLMFDELGFPLGERVECDPNPDRGGDFSTHHYRPVCAPMYSSIV